MRNVKISVVLSVFFLVGFLAVSAHANVSLRNGNFFIGYTDLVYPGGIEPKIERIYNSKSSYDGIFGYGWGSDFEVYLTVSADGSVVIHENGGGASNRFTPPNQKEADINKGIEETVDVKVKRGMISGSAIAGERKKLRNDARYRNDEWERLFVKGFVQGRKVSDGSQFHSNRFNYQTLTKTKDGYVRRFENGKIETFNNEGNLVRIVDRLGNALTLAYDKSGNLVTIKDNLNRVVQLAYSNKGKVEKITGDGGKTCAYKYNNNELVYAKDSENNVYEYKYSSNNRHNLVEIKYQDNTKLQVGYNDIKKAETVAWVKDRDGSLTEYSYGGDDSGEAAYYTEVSTKASDGKLITKSKYEYLEKAKTDGERFTYKLATEIDGDRTETIYNENSLPVTITRNGAVTGFEYDKKGHVIKKTTPSEITQLSYDSKTGKIARVSRQPAKQLTKGSTKQTWAEYKYDNTGNLVFAKSSDGKTVKLVYDLQGRIKALIDQKNSQLQFTYNEANRPVEIKDPKVGKIQVQYTESGEVKKVDSTGGRTVASHVTSTFQNLLDIIRPAGVSLTF